MCGLERRRNVNREKEREEGLGWLKEAFWR